MVSLPTIESYPPKQLQEACKHSSALLRYLGLLKKTTTSIEDQWRHQRHQHWCEATLATILNTTSSEKICNVWSEKTELLLKEAWAHFQLDQESIALIAMGKLGAKELNLSSDIDLIFVGQNEVDSNLLKKIRQWMRALSLVTDFGFCYRIDVDLRPGGSSSPLISSWDHWLNHYGSRGETWERGAMVRARALCGPKTLIKDISNFCNKFAYRKHIDLSLFNDLFLMRERIQKSHQNSFLNLKYQSGGIRDLELFVHSLQLIHGGKQPQLQTTSTTEALLQIQKLSFLRPDDSQFLMESYWFYRDIENKIQCLEDQHTYDIPQPPPPLISQAEIKKFLETAQKVGHLVETFLAPHKPKLHFVSDAEILKQASSLAEEKKVSTETIQEFIHKDVRSRTYDRDENERRHFLQKCLDWLQKSKDPVDLPILHLQSFLKNTRAKTSLYTLFNTHPELIEELLWIFSFSPYLSQILIHRPELMDIFLMKTTHIDTNDDESFFKSLSDYKLVSELISASTFLRNQDVHLLGETLSKTADTIAIHLLKYHLKKYPHLQLDLLTLGKWSSHEMGIKSDLDFIFLTDQSIEPEHLKVARRWISSLQSASAQLSLYSIDLRLRPTGSSGPLLIQKKELRDYLNHKGQIWERQAYLRARQLSDSQFLNLLDHRSLTKEEKISLLEIQNKLLKKPTDSINIKWSYGGLTHSEFTVQLALLDQKLQPPAGDFATMVNTLPITKDQRQLLIKNYFQLRCYHQLLILLAETTQVELTRRSPLHVKMQSFYKGPNDIWEDLLTLTKSQDVLLKELDPLR